MRLSVIIPAYKEPYLQRTIDSLLAGSDLGGELEVIPVLDGPWMAGTVKEDPRIRVIQFGAQRGMRAAVNAGLEVATGEYVLKVDAHCAFAPGFDRIMVENCEVDWLVIPRRYSLDENAWRATKRRWPCDYHYLNYPRGGFSMTPQPWARRGRTEAIDDTLTFQGSCWLANRKHFDKIICSLDSRGYGPFWMEQLEVGLKYWLSGGAVKVNKLTWYAHLAKRPRHYESGLYSRQEKTGEDAKERLNWATRHWLNNEEPGMVRPFAWLIEKFAPVPTWPADRSLWRIA